MAKQASPTRARRRKAPEKIKLDLACGGAKADGYVGVDLAGDADVIHDLLELPWPFDDDQVEAARCHHFVEHIPHWRPGWDRDGWWRFFDELWRVCADGAQVEIVHPWSRSDRAFWDPTHVRFIADQTWYYLDRGWRELNGIGHYPVECDFEVTTITGVGVPDHIMGRSEDFVAFARAHYFNVWADLQVILTARKGSR